MWRRSLSCMLGGIFVVTPIVVWGSPPMWIADRNPKLIIPIMIVSFGIIGIMILYDELTPLISLKGKQSQGGRN